MWRKTCRPSANSLTNAVSSPRTCRARSSSSRIWSSAPRGSTGPGPGQARHRDDLLLPALALVLDHPLVGLVPGGQQPGVGAAGRPAEADPQAGLGHAQGELRGQGLDRHGRQVRDEHGELVAAGAGRHGPQGAGQPLDQALAEGAEHVVDGRGDAAQDVVACVVTGPLVAVGEPVHVEGEDRGGGAEAGRPSLHGRDGRVPAGPVQQAREGIGPGFGGQLVGVQLGVEQAAEQGAEGREQLALLGQPGAGVASEGAQAAEEPTVAVAQGHPGVRPEDTSLAGGDLGVLRGLEGVRDQAGPRVASHDGAEAVLPGRRSTWCEPDVEAVEDVQDEVALAVVAGHERHPEPESLGQEREHALRGAGERRRLGGGEQGHALIVRAGGRVVHGHLGRSKPGRTHG
jgi:hypothetical protein